VLLATRGTSRSADGERDAFLEWCVDRARRQVRSLFATSESALAKLDTSYDRIVLAPELFPKDLKSPRSFEIGRFGFYLFTKPPGPWALRESANGRFEWMPATVRIGRKMRQLADIVSAVPGCGIETAVAGADGYLSASGIYKPLERAIAAGLVVADWADREHVRLFTTGIARRIWYLSAELQQPDTSTERIRGIHHELAELHAALAATWADGPAIPR
jgi:hypothetical protein